MIVPKLHQSIPANLSRHQFTLFVGHLPALPSASSQQVLPSVAIKVRLEKRKSKRTTENTAQIAQKQAELKALNSRQAEIETKISGPGTESDTKAKLVSQLTEIQKARDKLRADISELLVSQACRHRLQECLQFDEPSITLGHPRSVQHSGHGLAQISV